jgi:hypothetical protein
MEEPEVVTAKLAPTRCEGRKRNGNVCRARASLHEGGGHFCKVHAPSVVKKRRDEKAKRITERTDARIRMHRAHSRVWLAENSIRAAGNAVVAAAVTFVEAERKVHAELGTQMNDPLAKAVADLLAAQHEHAVARMEMQHVNAHYAALKKRRVKP